MHAGQLGKARQFAAELKADMGGTEIGPALQAAYAAASGSESGGVFVVTDGEVSSWEVVVAEAKRSGPRSSRSASAARSRGIRARTGRGDRRRVELVSPREGMAESRISALRAHAGAAREAVRSDWPEGARDLARPHSAPVFEGDTRDRLGAVRPSVNHRPRHARNRDGDGDRVPAAAGDDVAARLSEPSVNGGAARRNRHA